MATVIMKDDKGVTREVHVDDGLFYGVWTTELPTKEGWYWVYDKVFNHTGIIYYQYSFPDERFIANGIDESPVGGNDMDINRFSYWLGPLPDPKSPQE